MSWSNSTRVHVLHLVSGLRPGGLELILSRLVSGLTGPTMRHSVACLKGEAEIRDLFPPQTRIYCLHATPNEPTLPLRLWRLIERTGAHVLHANNWGAWPDVCVGRLLSLPPVPLVFSYHGKESASRQPLRRRVAFRVLSHITTELLTVSDASRNELVADYGWPRRRIRVIPNGVDTDLYSPPQRRGDTGGTFVVGTAGGLRPVKNHAMLMRAFAATGNDRFRLRIAGIGPEMAKLRALAQSLGIDGQCELPGFVRDVPKFLRSLDVFVLSSDSEQHPLALLEAMACGLPCISTRVGSVEQVLDGGNCGLIVPPGDMTALADAIRRLFRDTVLRQKLGAAGRRRVCQHYSLKRMLQAYDALYRHLVTRRSALF